MDANTRREFLFVNEVIDAVLLAVATISRTWEAPRAKKANLYRDICYTILELFSLSGGHQVRSADAWLQRAQVPSDVPVAN